MSSECVDADRNNHWKSQLTGDYNRCVDVTSLRPASHWPVQRSVNVRGTYHTELEGIFIFKEILEQHKRGGLGMEVPQRGPGAEPW